MSSHPPAMPLLTVDDLQKSYGTRSIFAGVSFSVEPGEKVGFIGVNGSGKTTLFRILAGEEGYESGSVAHPRGLTVGYLAQEPELVAGDSILRAVARGKAELLDVLTEHHEIGARLAAVDPEAMDRLLTRQATVMERIEALGGWDYEHRLEAILTRLDVDGWERQVEDLSGGERKRVALARVLVQQPELLILDEPTNHLDADTTLWLEETLLDYAGAVLLITHDRYFLDRVVTRMIEVNRAELIGFPGGFTEYLEAKADRQERLATAEAKRSKLIEQELEWVKRSPAARTGKQKARINRLGRTQRVQEEQRLPDQDVAEMTFGRPPRLGRTVLDLHGIGKAYDDRVLIRDFSTRLRAGERVGIVGPNGAGKTTLLRMILGEESPDDGSVELGKNTRIAYFDQRRSDLDPDANLLESVSAQDWVEVGGKRVHVRSYLNRYLFPNETHEQKVSSLSGGERNRLLLARLLTEEANLLILDEPTNDLDLFTLQVLESELVEFPGSVLVVTHDRYFLDKVATALFVFEGGGRVRRHEGGYDSYRRRREAAAANAAASRSSAPKKATREDGRTGEPRPRRLSYREKQELDGIEQAIQEADAARARIETELSDPSLYSDSPERVPALTAAFDEARQRVETLYARWAELETIREAQ